MSGVNELLNVVFAHAQLRVEQKNKCLCDSTTRNMCNRKEVLCHLYHNGFMRNYHILRFHGEDDNFIQVNHDITSICKIGKLKKAFRDLFVDVSIE